MAQKKSYRLEREFGLVVGGIFTLLGCWWIYRVKFLPVAQILLVAGIAGALLGVLFPRVLVLPRRGWMTFGEAISFVITRVILGIVFFLVVTPIGVVKRLSGWDPLRRRSGSDPSYWKPYPDKQRDVRHYEKMY